MSEPAGVVCRDCPRRAYLNLRGDAEDPQFRAAITMIATVDLPVESCTWNGADGSSVYWLGPNEWLLAVVDRTASDLEKELRALHERLSVSDVTGAQVHVELSGTAVGKVLQKSSPYDFHPRNFPPGRCAQTVFAKATALVAAKEHGAFDIVFRRSYADYLKRWIEDAATEYGYRVG